MDKYIAIVGAVREEIAGIKRKMKVEESGSAGDVKYWAGVWEGRRVVLVQSGMGKARALEAIQKIAERFPLALIISMGYAGSVDMELNLGDLVLADKVLEKAPDSSRPLCEISLDSPYLDQAMAMAPFDNINVHRGGLLTVEEVVHKPQQKKELGETFPVLAVEMETSALAQWSVDNEIPLLSVRSIIDTIEQELINVSSLQDKSGEVSRLKAGWYVLTHPGALKDLVEISQQARVATASATRFIGRYLNQCE